MTSLRIDTVWRWPNMQNVKSATASNRGRHYQKTARLQEPKSEFACAYPAKLA